MDCAVLSDFACHLPLEQAREEIRAEDSSVGGFNLGVNDGEAAGQTVTHAPIHLIPRRRGDVADPRGRLGT
jgi:diadenosine tetraphosphate (Ap4A) HIT family hydrolase